MVTRSIDQQIVLSSRQMKALRKAFATPGKQVRGPFKGKAVHYDLATPTLKQARSHTKGTTSTKSTKSTQR